MRAGAHWSRRNTCSLAGLAVYSILWIHPDFGEWDGWWSRIATPLFGCTMQRETGREILNGNLQPAKFWYPYPTAFFENQLFFVIQIYRILRTCDTFNYLPYGPYQFLQLFIHNNKCFSLKLLGNGKE